MYDKCQTRKNMDSKLVKEVMDVQEAMASIGYTCSGIKSGINYCIVSINRVLKEKIGEKLREKSLLSSSFREKAATLSTQTKLQKLTKVPMETRKRGKETQSPPSGSVDEHPALKKTKTQLGFTWSKVVVRRRTTKKEKALMEKKDTEVLGPPRSNTPAKGHVDLKKKRRIPREAVTISPAPGNNYAVVLKDIQKKVKPEDHGVSVKVV